MTIDRLRGSPSVALRSGRRIRHRRWACRRHSRIGRLTQDIDVVYSRSSANIERLVAALGPHAPYLRGAPPGLPFEWSAATIDRGLNFTLTTAIGDIDLLGEIAGAGDYDALVPHTVEVDIFGFRCRCLNLPRLIGAKRATGRPKDLDALAELEALLEERGA